MKINTTLFLFSVWAGIVSSFLIGYNYGGLDQIEAIPLIYRVQNPNYLARDFFLNADSGLGPRFFFVQALALLSPPNLLPFAVLILTLLVNFAIVFISVRFTYVLCQSAKAAVLAGVFVASLDYVLFGSTSLIQNLTPMSLALPLLFLCIWWGINSSLTLSAFAAAIASLFHPTLGLGTGAIVLAAAALQKLSSKKFVKSTLMLPVFYLGLVTCLWLGLSIGSSHISTWQFSQIFVHERSAHHVLPQTWERHLYFNSFGFLLLAFAAGYYLWRKKILAWEKLQTMIAMILIVLFLCVADFFFADSFAVRFWAIFMPFRFLYIVKWLGLIISAIALVHLAQKTKIVTLLVLGSAASPIIFGLAAAAAFFMSAKHTVIKILLSILFLIICWLTPLTDTDMKLILMRCLIVGTIGWFVLSLKSLGKLAASVCSLLLIAVLFFQPLHFFPTKLASVIAYLKPVVTENDYGSLTILAKYVQNQTPPDSIFLVPPFAAEFRWLSQRALVVDYRNIPFRETEMVHWLERIRDIYGQNPYMDFRKNELYEQNYRNLSDNQLTFLKQKYHATHALLYTETITQYPAIIKTSDFKVVRLEK